MKTCPICKKETADYGLLANGLQEITCLICGQYYLAVMFSGFYEPDYLLSSYIRRHQTYTSRGSEIIVVNYSEITKIKEEIGTPTLSEKIDYLIEHLSLFQKDSGEFIKLRYMMDYPIFFCANAKEFSFILRKAKELKFIEVKGNVVLEDELDLSGFDSEKQDWFSEIRLDIDGIKRINELKKVNRDSSKCFVAMSFEGFFQATYEKGIESVFKEEGLNHLTPVLINKKEYNGRIDDEIIASIRESKFMIADFTYNNPNVYFEAGFAEGQRIPVIHICKKEYFDENMKKLPGDKDKIKFDVEHHNFILYTSTTDLKEQLVNRIKATII